jgi:thiol-disulfide isomerase/thioredoxin
MVLCCDALTSQNLYLLKILFYLIVSGEFMKKCLFFYIAVLFIAASGCLDTTSSSGDSTVVSTIVNVQNQQQIDEALASGPVFVDMGFASCPACKIMKPTIEEIAQEYSRKATVMYLDTRETPEIAMGFDVYSVPDMFVIVDRDSEGYLYMTSDGNITRDRNIARFIGVTEKDILTQTLDLAIASRQNK